MLDSVQAFHEMMDQQAGIHDGVSLAYNVSSSKLTLQQALDAAQGRNEFYLRGLVEGFNTIRPKDKLDVRSW